MTDILFIGIAVLGCASLLNCQGRRGWTIWAAVVVLVAAAIWGQLLAAGPIGQLAPSIVAMFVLPGFLVLELAFPGIARKLGALERGPLLFGLSMGVWTLIAAVAYRARLPSDAVIGGVLVTNIVGLLAVVRYRLGRSDSQTLLAEKQEPLRSVKFVYLICLLLTLLLVSGIVGFTTQFQRHDFDACTHLAGYRKIADSARIIGGNPFLGPGHAYAIHYVANPWYLVFGLSARLSHADVTWLYVCLAALLTPLVFLSFYSLLNTLTKSFWTAMIGTLMVIGPWVSHEALRWGPSTGTFYLQFLPYPYTYTKLIIFPILTVYCFRYVYSQRWEDWALTAILAVTAMGHHPVFLVAIPLSIGIAFVISLFFPDTLRYRAKTAALVVVIVVSAAIIAYSLVSNPLSSVPKPMSEDQLHNNWDKYVKNSWKIGTDLYAVHPRSLTDNWKAILGCAVLALFVGFQPRLSAKKKRWMPVSISASPQRAQWRMAATAAAVLVGPYLIVCNPVIVPWMYKLLKSPVPFYRMPSTVVLGLVCQFGALASILALMLSYNGLEKHWKSLKLILLFVILILGIGLPFFKPTVRSAIAGIVVNSNGNPSILDLGNDPLYTGLSQLEPGVVAIEQKKTEFATMSTPHYVVAASRVAKERRLDNERIVKFSVTPEAMKVLLSKYDCRYVVVPLYGNIVSNGQFSTRTASWDALISCTIESVPGGQNGNCLQLTRTGYDSQIVYQNITCDVGKIYEIKGYVKSGTSGDEPYAIQIFQKNASGYGEFSIDGTTNDFWVEYSMVFKANYRDLCIVLRKKSATPGTMLFDDISCHEVAPRYAAAGGVEKNRHGNTPVKDGDRNSKEFIPHNTSLQRFREHPELFDEIITLEEYAIFRVENN